MLTETVILSEFENTTQLEKYEKTNDFIFSILYHNLEWSKGIPG